MAFLARCPCSSCRCPKRIELPPVPVWMGSPTVACARCGAFYATWPLGEIAMSVEVQPESH